jgi:hypothetical protein
MLAILMAPADLRAFARRDRAPVEDLKREHWAREFRERGGLATLRAGHGTNARAPGASRPEAKRVDHSTTQVDIQVLRR